MKKGWTEEDFIKRARHMAYWGIPDDEILEDLVEQGCKDPPKIMRTGKFWARLDEIADKAVENANHRQP